MRKREEGGRGQSAEHELLYRKMRGKHKGTSECSHPKDGFGKYDPLSQGRKELTSIQQHDSVLPDREAIP